MNKYQREHVHKVLQIEDSNCCQYLYDVEHLPQDVMASVEMGEVKKIRDYLAMDNDPNALHDGETMLSRACFIGQTEILQELLQCPDIHLNVLYQGMTPLDRAASNRHISCVRMLLESRLKCRVNLESGWRSVVMVLNQRPTLSSKAAIYIMNWAAYTNQWEAVTLVLQNYYQIPAISLYFLAMQAFDQDQWEIVQLVFQKHFYGRNDSLAEMLALTVQARDWEKVKRVLHVMDETLQLAMPLVEAAIEGDVGIVDQLLKESNYSANVLNTSFLVISAGGTTESVVQKLIAFCSTYTQKTFANALFLAMHGVNTEFLLHLLCHPNASYTFHELSRARSILQVANTDAESIFERDRSRNYDHVSNVIDELIRTKINENP